MSTLRSLEGAGVQRIADVLGWTIETRCTVLGGDGLAEVLDALPALAAEQPRAPVLRPTREPGHIAETLAIRWGDVPVGRIGFSAGTTLALRDAGILTLGQLLGALHPLCAVLFLDLQAFREVSADSSTLDYGPAKPWFPARHWRRVAQLH